MARNPNIGDGTPLNLTLPAGLYDFLTQHARRAVLGKNEGEIAIYLMQQQAVAWDSDAFMGIRFTNRDFLSPSAEPPSAE